MLNLLSLTLSFSALSTLACANIDLWRKDGLASPDSCPWGDRTSAMSHPQRDMPDTGIVRYYDFTTARGTLSPDGYSKSGFTINGQSPGPLLEANWGDWFSVNVYNAIDDEGTALHWHGLNQEGTPWYDGTPSVSMCPIAPGTNLTYRFRADEYGSSWYHAHYSSQYTDGLVGPMIIHGPSTHDYDNDMGIIFIQDWFHGSYQANLEAALEAQPFPGFPPLSDSNLLNGLGIFNCASDTAGASCTGGTNYTTTFQSGSSYRMRFVNAASQAFYTIALDNHTFTVIANDFTPIIPYDTDSITLGVGQRIDVVVQADADPTESYWLRVFNSPGCGASYEPDARGIIHYEQSDPSTVPTSTGPAPPVSTLCLDDPLSSTVPAYAIPATPNPSTLLTFNVTIFPNATGSNVWALNGIPFEGDYNAPILETFLSNPSTTFPIERNVLAYPSNSSSSSSLSTSQQTIRALVTTIYPAPHPMHLHGHDFRILSTGYGQWDGSITNPANPMRRDVAMLPAVTNLTLTGPSYVVLEWDLDNPGAWPFHCHIAEHLSSGLNVVFLEQPEVLARMEMQMPQNVRETCEKWDLWTRGNVVDQLDDGL